MLTLQATTQRMPGFFFIQTAYTLLPIPLRYFFYHFFIFHIAFCSLKDLFPPVMQGNFAARLKLIATPLRGVVRKSILVVLHTSHVTRHTSNVTRHTSHVTRHLQAKASTKTAATPAK